MKILTVSDIARMAGVSPQAAHRWHSCKDFPEAYVTLTGKRYWTERDVARWLRHNRQLPAEGSLEEQIDDGDDLIEDLHRALHEFLRGPSFATLATVRDALLDVRAFVSQIAEGEVKEDILTDKVASQRP